MRLPRRARFLIVLVGFGLVLGGIGGVTYGAFFSTTSNSGNSFTSAADWTPPSASASVIAKQTGYLAGNIKQGGTFFVYANASDTGNPAGGISTIAADVSNIRTGATAVALTTTGGPWSVQGTSYTYRSAVQTASNPLSPGSNTYTLTLSDVAGNSQTQTGFSVTVDNTVPAGSDIQAVNGGTTAGHPEPNDVITFTYTEPIDPQSILAGWTGASQAVQVRFTNNGCAPNDTFTIRTTGGVLLPLGTTCLGRGDYVAGTVDFSTSTMVQSGNTIVVTLGGTGAAGTAAGTGTMTWTPSATAYDAAGNTCSTTAVTESGTLDLDF